MEQGRGKYNYNVTKKVFSLSLDSFRIIPQMKLKVVYLQNIKNTINTCILLPPHPLIMHTSYKTAKNVIFLPPAGSDYPLNLFSLKPPTPCLYHALSPFWVWASVDFPQGLGQVGY